jgi:transcriptional regulator with XRE-family HTH domain
MIRLKAERLKKGWSQQDLGFYARISAAEVSRFENGWSKPYPAQAARLAATLGLTPDQLLDRVDFQPEMADAQA